MSSKFFFLSVFFSLFTTIAQADLLERMRLEDALRERLEQSFRIHDKNARVFTTFEYKSYQGELPGTSIASSQDFAPNKLESSDINRVRVEIYTEMTDVPDSVKSSIFKIIPVDRNKVTITYKQVQAPATSATAKAVEAKDISEIAERSINSLFKLVLAVLAISIITIFASVYYMGSKKLREVREQFSMLAKAITEGSTNAAAVLPHTSHAPALNYSGFSHSGKEGSKVNFLPIASLRELFADCYWCEEDAYANWIWKNLESSQRAELFNQLPLMKEYSLHFVSVFPRELFHHEHPYYMDPLPLWMISQEDLAKDVEANLEFWHQISPMRQDTLPLSLVQKLSAVQMKTVSPMIWNNTHQSAPRVLKTKMNWGDLSPQDEAVLYNNPNLVPDSLKENIRSLIWLAQKADDAIQKSLAKFDARSLATAWIGPEEVLKRLQDNLPEKKLRMLQTYLEKSAPDRNSPAYQNLVSEGLKNEAA